MLLLILICHISSSLQSRRFPEDSWVGHQSSGRPNHQRLLPRGVSYQLLVLKIRLYAGLCIKRLTRNHHRSEQASAVAAWSTSANCVRSKSSGFLFLYFLQSFCFIILKEENQMFPNISLKSPKVRWCFIFSRGWWWFLEVFLLLWFFRCCLTWEQTCRGGLC